MIKVAAALTEIRAMPLVFRASIALLAVAATIGQLTQYRSAGLWSKTVLIAAERACPKAARPPASRTVGDAERTADRAMRWMILDRAMPLPLSRCHLGRQDGA